MTLRRLCVALALATITSGGVPSAASQEPCRVVLPPPSRGANIFTEAQESDLGDAIAEQVERQYRVIDDQPLTEPLSAIVSRLTATLPPSALRFRAHVVDSADANAWVAPGGRIYVTRKLIAFTQSEDELAGVVSHEIGHLLARQLTEMLSRDFKRTLNVTEVGDRQDIFNKFNRLLDNASKASGAESIDEHQIEADRLGLTVSAAAGYDPAAQASFFERFAKSETEPGGLLGLFRRTPPDTKRLRAMLKMQAATPRPCATAAARPSAETYREWRGAVASYVGGGRKDSLPGLVARVALDPPLRGDLASLKFSRDGKFVLAQDTSTITVMSREPFQVLFAIDAPSAVSPHFSAASDQVVFHTADLQVQIWQIASRRLQNVHELVLSERCRQSVLAPDGRVLACLTVNLDLVLYDVPTNAEIWRRKALIDPLLYAGAALPMTIAFSSDGRYLAAGVRLRNGTAEALVFDLPSKALVALKNDARAVLADGFAFMGNGQILASNRNDPQKSVLIALPAGAVAETLPLVRGRIDTATSGRFAFVRPFEKYAVAVLDLALGRITKGSLYSAIDVYDGFMVAERTTGELGLYAMEGSRFLGGVTLPKDDLELRTAARSPDERLLAVAGPARSAIWDLTNGRRLALAPAFGGAVFAPDGFLYADVPATNGAPRHAARIDPRTGQSTNIGPLNEQIVVSTTGMALSYTAHVGKGILKVGPSGGGSFARRTSVLEMRDPTSLAPLWNKEFDGDPPRVLYDRRVDSLACAWFTNAPAVRDLVKDSPALQRRLATLHETIGNVLIEIYDVTTGARRGRFFVESGNLSYLVTGVVAAGDTVLVMDSSNRVHVYSMSTGERRGQVFGSSPILSPKGELVAVLNGRGALYLYDTATMKLRTQYAFARGVATAQFNVDATRLMAITLEQAAVTLAIPPAQP